MGAEHEALLGLADLDGHDARPAPEGVSFMPLRCAVDWATALYRAEPSGKVWKALMRVEEGGCVVGRTATGATIPFAVHRGPGDGYVILRAVGVWVRVQNPATRRVGDEGQPTDYAVEIQFQGALLASTAGGGADLIRDAQSAVEDLLFRHFGARHATRSQALRDYVVPGRWDLATDVAVSGPGASGWIEDALFCGGSLEHAAANFSSRARTPKQLKTVRGRDLDTLSLRAQGKASTGRTFYLGSMVELCVYEKDKPKDLASEVARETLQRDCGWDGEARLVRWEVRCTRAWFREQEMVVHGVPVRGDRLSFADFLEGLPMLAKTILGRFRHTEADPERPGLRRNERPTSAYGHAVQSALPLLWRGDDPRSCIERVVSKKREIAAERAEARAAGAINDVMALRSLTFFQAVQLVFDGQHLSRAEHWEERRRKVRARYGVELPAELRDDDEEDEGPPVVCDW